MVTKANRNKANGYVRAPDLELDFVKSKIMIDKYHE